MKIFTFQTFPQATKSKIKFTIILLYSYITITPQVLFKKYVELCTTDYTSHFKIKSLKANSILQVCDSDRKANQIDIPDN